MTLTSQIQSKIKKLPEGKTFGYAYLGIAKITGTIRPK
jgi:hypothetical protein